MYFMSAKKFFFSFVNKSGRREIFFNAGNLVYGKCIHKSAFSAHKNDVITSVPTCD